MRSFVHKCAEISTRSFIFEPELRRDTEMWIWKSLSQRTTEARGRNTVFQGSCRK